MQIESVRMLSNPSSNRPRRTVMGLVQQQTMERELEREISQAWTIGEEEPHTAGGIASRYLNKDERLSFGLR